MPRRKLQSAIPRRIGFAEIALYRAYLQGISVAKFNHRIRLGKEEAPSETLKWIRHELMMAARRHNHFRYARLISLKPEALAEIATGPGTAPDLETYRRIKDPDGSFYTEADLIKLFREDYPPDPNLERDLKRRARLRAKQKEALDYLTKLLAEHPNRSDPVVAWFEPALAARLENADITTVNALIERVELHGNSWYRTVPD